MADRAKQGGKGGGARKVGKKKDQQAMKHYTAAQMHFKNKARRIERMMRRFPKYKTPAGWIRRENGTVVPDIGRQSRAERRRMRHR